MAQYQILARKPLGPSGTGPKQTLEVKTAVATPPRSCRTAAHRRLHSAARATCAHGGGHLRAQRVQVGGRLRAAPCTTMVHGGRPADAAPAGRRKDAARSYNAHDSARCARRRRQPEKIFFLVS
ncbi:hypothetical protein F511_22275 [Dorcoceras hygrometricum]|uniref:Uncharacterized protein n=1 Tax=Dorcoceras hygrometricum TaxID=472368 RepID=A0A2Z7AGK3_9LAMI|nr:hypothetical protein F511_22275 [Dorcoceras hygrometricum]